MSHSREPKLTDYKMYWTGIVLCVLIIPFPVGMILMLLAAEKWQKDKEQYLLSVLDEQAKEVINGHQRI